MRLVTKLDKVAAGRIAVIMSKPWESLADLAESDALRLILQMTDGLQEVLVSHLYGYVQIASHGTTR